MFSRVNIRYNTYIFIAVLFFMTFVFMHRLLTTEQDCLSEDTTDLLCTKYRARRNRKISIDLTKPQTKIPKRLHQTFKDHRIPVNYHSHMKSWIKNHPDWEFFFWTDKSAEQMIKDRYPQYVDLFEKYDHPLTKSDAIRYFILHQFGGLYADLDMESLKPMESFLKSNTCVLVPEPTVQTNLIFNLDRSLTNCIMGGVAKHPFFEYILESLPKAYRKIEHNHDVLHSTGPFFLNKTFTEYHDKFKYCRNGAYCDVFISDHKLLVPRIDVPDLKHNVEHICSRNDIGKLQIKACEELVKSDFANPLPEEAFTDHHWLHLGWDHEKMKKVFNTRSIFEIMPDVITYEMIKGSIRNV